MALELDRETLESLAVLLEYPRTDPQGRMKAVQSSLSTCCPEASASLGCAREDTASWDGGKWEEAHLRTFEVAATCVPYVGVHLYGEETFKRGALMARLRTAFDQLGFEVEGELPDHVAVLLRFSARLEPSDRAELAQRMHSSTQAMQAALANSDNPYRHLVAAVAQVVEWLAAGLPPLEAEVELESSSGDAASCQGCSLPESVHGIGGAAAPGFLAHREPSCHQGES